MLSVAVFDVATLQWVYLALLCAFTISLGLMLQESQEIMRRHGLKTSRANMAAIDAMGAQMRDLG